MSLVSPHGGKLVNRLSSNTNTAGLKSIEITDEIAMDVQQIGVGTYSPLEGFMNKKDFISVVDSMKLVDGTFWPIPIVLDVNETVAGKIKPGEKIALNHNGKTVAILNTEEIFTCDKKVVAKKVFGTNDCAHPGVARLLNSGDYLIGGKIDLLVRTKHNNYDLTPAEVRSIFEKKGWNSVVGFHTRNVPHRAHEFVQLTALKNSGSDGLFIHPVVGKKKSGDFVAEAIIQGYELATKQFYPKEKVVLGTFTTYSRYAGPREAVFTALCRKNFGCSHFVVGRDHTGVGNYYAPTASQDLLKQLENQINMKIIVFPEVLYCKSCNSYTYDCPHTDKISISGTAIRSAIVSGKMPPTEAIRPEISTFLLQRIKNGQEVFVP